MQIGKNERVSCISWKPDYKLFAVGTRSGAIAIYNINLELETTIYAQHKRILKLSWHPEATAEDSETSPYHSWLAVSTLDVSIIIYDLTKERGSGKCLKYLIFKNINFNYCFKVMTVKMITDFLLF